MRRIEVSAPVLRMTVSFPDHSGDVATGPVRGRYSAKGRRVSIGLLDAYRIIVVHEQNHFVQARRVTESPGFPV
jgi:hypothetical protein